MGEARRTARVALGCRLLLASAFLVSGVAKLMDLDAAAAEVRALIRLEPAGLVSIAVVLVQLGGSGLLLAGGRAVVWGVAILAAFTLVATLIGHPFWSRTGAAAVRDATTFAEHLGLVGGLVLAALHPSRPRDPTP